MMVAFILTLPFHIFSVVVFIKVYLLDVCVADGDWHSLLK